MSNEKQIEALELAIEFLQKKVDKLKDEVTIQGDCPPGQIRNAQGKCVDRLD